MFDYIYIYIYIYIYMHHYLDYLGYLGDFKNSGNPVLVFLIPKKIFKKI